MKKLFKFLIPTIMLLTISCSDIFSVRSAEDPSGNQETNIAVTTTEFMDNFINSLEVGKTFMYKSLFTDSLSSGITYRFISETNDVNSEFFDTWTKKSEEDFIDLFFQNNYFSETKITYTENGIPSDSASIDIVYNLTAKDEAGIEKKVSGKSTFILIRNDGIWYIKKWVDQYTEPDDDAISFSKLKQSFSN